jgi:hypothetical protein
MNERIKKLAEQAGMTVDSDYSLYTKDFTTYGNFVEKFTHLIVQDCATWVNDNVGMVDEEARADLLKHFGVEL